MAKKDTGTVGKFGVRFLNFFQQGSVTPRAKEELSADKFVRFGSDNLWPQYVQALADNCAPLARAVEVTASMMAGTGIRFVDKEGNEIEAAQDIFQSWLTDTTEEEFLASVCYDIALFNACSLNVRRAAGASVVRLDHLDVSRLRSGYIKDGAVREFYWSSDWAEYAKSRGSKYEPEIIPAYMADEFEAKACIYSRTYKPGKDYYGEPWWLGAMQAAEVWTKIDPYNRVQIDTNFVPNVHIHVPAHMDEADQAYLQRDMERAYYGARGKGAFLTTGNPGVEGDRVEITPINTTPNAGKLDTIREEAAAVIYDGYGIPRILVTEQSSGLASQGQSYKEQLNGFLKMRVYPGRKLLTRKLTALMNAAGVPVWDSVIEDVDLVSEEMDAVMLRQAYIRTVRVDEHREKVLGYEPIGGKEGEAFIIASGAADGGEPV